MTIQELVNKIDNSSEDKGLSNLLNAITDWPIEVNSIESYLESVMTFLCIDEINDIVINKALIKIDESKFIWEVESINELLIFLNKHDDYSFLFKNM